MKSVYIMFYSNYKLSKRLDFEAFIEFLYDGAYSFIWCVSMLAGLSTLWFFFRFRDF